MIERIEVNAGPGTVIRYGGVVAWADPAASPALISFLAQSARNLGPSPRGGRQIADHIAGVLASRDPEPHVAFAVIGPSDHGWASLLHGPVQAWDGARWLAPSPSPGWLQAIITPRPAITVSAAGAPSPAVQPDALWDLEAGVVPGAGFVLVPASAPGRFAVVRPEVADQLGPDREGVVDDGAGLGAGATAAAVTAVLPSSAPTMAMPAVGTQAEAMMEPEAESSPAESSPAESSPAAESGLAAAAVPTAASEIGAASEAEPEREPSDLEPEAEPGVASAEPAPEPSAEPESAPESPPPPRRPVVPGPAGSLDLRAVPPGVGAPLPSGAGPDQRVPGAPVVAGILCGRGHLNRPGLAVCARCRLPIPDGGREQVSGSRPPLGVLITDDGSIFRLDRGYLVGSNAGRDPTVGGGLARPLTLSGSDVSSSHAELRLTDWDVTVVDRGSAAGTCVFEPGATEWARLTPYEPRVIPPGTHLAFGQRVVTLIAPWVPTA
jgi:hypothetical protein